MTRRRRNWACTWTLIRTTRPCGWSMLPCSWTRAKTMMPWPSSTALIYFRKKEYDKSIPVLKSAVALAPKDSDLPAQLGHAYMENKDYPDAVNELVVAIKMNPSSNDVLTDLVAAEYLNKNYPAALRGLDLLAQRETLPLGSWFIRATCYDKLGQSAPALEAYQKFLQLNKDENSDMYFQAAARARTLTRELQNKKR